MFRKEFADVISETGMVPIKDLRPLLLDDDQQKISEFDLLKFDFFDDVKFAKQVAQKRELVYIDLSGAKVPVHTINLIKKNNAIKFRCIPVKKTGSGITMAIYDPSIVALKKDIQTLMQNNIEFILIDLGMWVKLFADILVSIEEIISTVKEIKADSEEEQQTTIKEEDIGEDVIRYVNKIFAEAYIKKASDIHIEPYESRCRIRFRIDGNLSEIPSPSKSLMLPIISRVKIMAKMDISEKRKPQNGRIKLYIGGDTIDFRVSSLPTLHGEKIVVRILDSTNLQRDMTQLGFEQKQLDVFRDGIFRPYGMCLVTGPTGSGKTTTLYSALKELSSIDVNVSTAEDPVEFNMEGVNQVNVRKDIGLTFAEALKSFLRQDPDIIMVGEIRDSETAATAIEAALTGHLVLSTVHANDAPSTLTRLLNMGLEPFLVVGAMNVVVAQRLCRRICEHCKAIDPVPVEKLMACGLSENSAQKIKVYKGTGCKFCNDTGYKGRTAIYEVMDMTPNVREAVLKNSSSDQIKRIAIKDGMKTLRMSALTKVAKGETTLEEALINSAADKL